MNRNPPNFPVPAGPELCVEGPDGNLHVSPTGRMTHSLWDGPNPVPNLPGNYDNVRMDPGKP